jgi:hypothetical protein
MLWDAPHAARVAEMDRRRANVRCFMGLFWFSLR